MNTLLQIKNIVKHFPAKTGFFEAGSGVIHALNDVSFTVEHGETLGLVGESGCGKSTLAKIIARLIPSTSGKIFFEGEDITHLAQNKLKKIRRNIQFVFQDPQASLNPHMTIVNTVSEPFVVHGLCSAKGAIPEAERILSLAGVPKEMVSRYPHEFSTGQRQRIAIARALALNPKLIIADEPIASLDVSIQAQILNLFKELKDKFNLTYIFISHDLRVIEYISDRVIVMYLGKIMEVAKNSDLYRHPIHPYTEALISAIPVPDPATKKKRIILRGEIPGTTKLPSGCVFHTRCVYAKQKCVDEIPELTRRDGRSFACHFPLE
ncbi:MAG: ABC transporter ATP-binding protein [Candidatus Omnitrophica bacterium]|jgi:ABC-type oligopeptide transport system ATPase subunit|nr:ABC transporter ATP-binding protein [Candidatus Omnitrophota bacterium]